MEFGCYGFILLISYSYQENILKVSQKTKTKKPSLHCNMIYKLYHVYIKETQNLGIVHWTHKHIRQTLHA